MIRRTLACALILNMTWTGWVWAQAPDSSPDREQQGRGEAALARLDHLIEILEVGRESMDRIWLDLESLLDFLEYEPEQIIRFVRERIAFQQYPGLLRGARGTLMARSGNSLDQALLLAKLLKDSGLDARIVRGTLTPTQTSTLIGEMRQVEKDSSDLPASSQASLEEAITESGGIDGVIEETVSLPESAAINQKTSQILDALSRDGITLGSSSARVELENEARDYFWVELRGGPSESWLPIQPAFDTPAGDFPDLVPEEIFEDEIPSSLQHRLRFRVFIEQKSGDELTVHPIMDPWERPVANLLQEPVSYANFPSGMSRETMDASWDDILDQSSLFIPVLNGNPAPGARGFDRNGILFDLDAQGMDTFGATALIQTVGGKTESAAGALASLGAAEELGPADDLMALTSEWIEYSVISPTGDETTYQKVIFDRLGQDRRLAGKVGPLESDELYRRLVFGHTFMVAGGDYPRALLADRLISSLIDQRAFLHKIHGGGQAGGGNSNDLVLPDDLPLHPHFFLFNIFDRQGPQEDGVLRYRSSPGLVAVQQGLGTGQDGYVLVDIIRSPHRAFEESADGWISAPDEVLRQGVWETLSEAVLVAQQTPPETTGRTFLTTGSLGKDPLVLRGNTLRPGSADFPWPADATYSIEEDLRRGYIVIIPEAAKVSHQAAWWRVDPVTGESLGMIQDGRGGAAEYLIILGGIAVILFLVLDGPGFIGCYQAGHRGRHLSCCYERERNKKYLNLTQASKFDWATSMVGEMERERRVVCNETGPPRPTR